MFYTYILFSVSTNKYYVGSCADITVRLAQHNSSQIISTKGGAPWILKKVETFSTRSEAMQREYFIKRMKSRKFVELVIEGLR